ncbi:UPF0711 protein C18orf21 homolog [Lampris incognitus]|uniref:UPF0711 protein C18orf21 homolog n=1 Tax=Lampris incognitus TaxID=2546036 RepID=UPI0024B59C66|nr:UPF0711 protein C18orf21 homolog [Lampris incognitus]
MAATAVSAEEKSVHFLLDASILYQQRCPELSRFLMQKPQKVNAQSMLRSSNLFEKTSVCEHCSQWFQPGNHRVRLRPKRRPSWRVQSVLRLVARHKWLSLTQKELLRRFMASSSILMATCHSCNRTTRHKGVNRDFIATMSKTHSTPGSTGKRKTPQSTNRAHMTTPKMTSKEKTPSNTPRSTSSKTPGSGSSSTKSTSKVKKWVVKRLSKILIREDNQGSKKGGLKDFLSSI